MILILILYFSIVKSFVELLRYILRIPGVKFFLSERLSQDPLENFFGCQRQRCRTNGNPNLHEFCKNTQALRVINSVCGTVSKGNCRGNKQVTDMDENNKPLPKRRRVRKQESKSLHPVKSSVTSAPSDPVTSSVTSAPSHPVSSTVTSVRLHSVTCSVTSAPSHPVSSSVTSAPSHPVTCSVTSAPSHPVSSSVTSAPLHSVTYSVTSAPSHPVSSSVTSTPLHSITSSVTSAPSHPVISSVTSVPLHLGTNSKLTTCQGNLNGTDSVTAISVPSVIATVLLSGLSDDDSETESELDLWDDSDDSLMDTTTEPSNHLCSTAASGQLAAIAWLQHSNVHKGIIDKILGPGVADEELSRGFGIVLRRQDFWTLKHSEWLNDQVSHSKVSVPCLFFVLQVINFYLKLLAEAFDNIYVYSTFFYPKVLSCGYNAVQQWTHGEDIFSKRLLLFPIHLNIHWCLAVVDLAEHSISYYDSLKKANPVCLKTIHNYLMQHSSNRLVNWKLVHYSDIPEQLNSSDCGVFVCMYARYLSYASPFSFSQMEMSSIRRHVALELFLKKLLH